jgi:pSer/pThr/pTyr-binding forkhead associated (FHA) protein
MALVTLRVVDGADRGRTYGDLTTPITIGREEGNSIQLNDERISRFHLKIQEDREKIVLTDLESTNGTKVNGEEIQLRILRFGDLIAVGRSVLLFGSREQIAQRLARLRGDRKEDPTRSPVEAAANQEAEDFDMNWAEDPDIHETLHAAEPPELPEHLTPAQAAQLCELIGYIHLRIRELVEPVVIKSPHDAIAIDFEQWQTMLDINSRLGEYLRAISDPRTRDQ